MMSANYYWSAEKVEGHEPDELWVDVYVYTSQTIHEGGHVSHDDFYESRTIGTDAHACVLAIGDIELDEKLTVRDVDGLFDALLQELDANWTAIMDGRPAEGSIVLAKEDQC